MKIKMGQIQMHITDDKKANIQKADRLIDKVVKQGADIVVLPEMFNCPYTSSSFPKYAETEGGDTYQFLSEKAREKDIYLFGGSIPEKTMDNKIYNTCYVFDRTGNKIGKHRKTHLFDINIKGGQVFRESDTLSPGNDATVVETEFCKMGVMICYDIRFPEFARLMALKGAKVIIVPGAFNMTTGPAHWEILFRTRAVDNQVFTVGTSPARDVNGVYVSYANSIVVSPWGTVINRFDGEETVCVTEIDLDDVYNIRQQLPVLEQRRTDLY
ncbi:MAG: N-carbamoyl-D-amino acid amidohydrolase [Clostridiales bacterium 38_11]|nr:MAG: N-carbamoyl-D-amino acid amidohydrolase [Clostridiales bacterium 38_11]